MSNEPKTMQAFEALKSYLIANCNAKVASGGKEIIKKCHFCGDSKDPTSAHLYIGLKPNGSIVYNCFKCNTSGVVDGKFLRDIGCYDPNIINLCLEQNKISNGSNRSRSGSYRNGNSYKFQSPYISTKLDAYGTKKLKYISERLMVPIDVHDVGKFKIILNLKEFLSGNGIDQYTRQQELVDLLDKFFVGFLSIDNNYVVLRRLVPEGKLPKYIDTRYVNYDIFGKSTGNKYYVVPAMINTLLPIDIHIAEGPFDILSIYLNLKHENQNSIYIAICGRSYESAIKYLVTTYGLCSFNLHVYMDNDVKVESMVYMIKTNLKIFCKNAWIHRNSMPGEKDFGVSPDRISENIIKVL